MSQPHTYREPRVPLVHTGQADLHLRDMTATFAADLTLHAAQELLAAENQWIPIDGDPDDTLANLVNFDSTGPLRLGYGAWRDLLLGVQFTNGNGELISAGGRTVKNVAGYDLTKFMVGQAGIFGQIISLTTRTYLRPAIALLASAEPHASIVSELMATPCRPHWAILTRDRLLLGYLGDRQMIDYQRTALPKYIGADLIERSLEEDQADRARLWRAHGRVRFRASVPPAKVEEFLGAVSMENWVAAPAFGIVLGFVNTTDELGHVTTAAGALGGTLRSLSPESNHAGFMVANEPERRILEQLKIAFDPAGNLRPLPWQGQP